MKPEETLDAELSYSDRVFDFGRWKLSLLLPDIVRALAQTKCYHTGKGNFFTIQVIDDAGNKAEYEVFFETYVRRNGKKSRLNLVVQSAYVRDWKHSNRPHTKLIRFEVILYNVMNGREIKTP